MTSPPLAARIDQAIVDMTATRDMWADIATIPELKKGQQLLIDLLVDVRADFDAQRAKVATLEAERDEARAEKDANVRGMNLAVDNQVRAYRLRDEAIARADALEASLTSARLAREELEKRVSNLKWDMDCVVAQLGVTSREDLPTAVMKFTQQATARADKQQARAIAAEAEARTLREALIEANEFTLVGISRGPAIPRWVQMRAKLEAALTSPAGEEQTK